MRVSARARGLDARERINLLTRGSKYAHMGGQREYGLWGTHPASTRRHELFALLFSALEAIAANDIIAVDIFRRHPYTANELITREREETNIILRYQSVFLFQEERSQPA